MTDTEEMDEQIPGVIYRPDNDSLYWAGVVTDQVDYSRESGRKVAAELLARLPR